MTQENPLLLPLEEFRAYHDRRMVELEEQHKRFMAEWDHIGSEENRLEIARVILEETHAPEYSTPEESEDGTPTTADQPEVQHRNVQDDATSDQGEPCVVTSTDEQLTRAVDEDDRRP